MARFAKEPCFEDVESFGVSRESFDRVAHYYHLLLKWQKAINLVSPNSLPNAWKRHFMDSVQMLRYVPIGSVSCVDLGSGGGFAGLVVALCRPDVSMHLIDSDQRKCQFLRTVSRESGISNVNVYCGRVEQILSDLTFDLVSARGFTALDTILSMAYEVLSTERLLDVTFTLLKGESHLDEIAAAQKVFSFDYEAHESITDKSARVLTIKNVSKL